jgi:hypothetical protein
LFNRVGNGEDRYLVAGVQVEVREHRHAHRDDDGGGQREQRTPLAATWFEA